MRIQLIVLSVAVASLACSRPSGMADETPDDRGIAVSAETTSPASRTVCPEIVCPEAGCPECPALVPCPSCPACPSCEKPDAVCSTAAAVLVGSDPRFVVRTMLHRNGAWYETLGTSQIGPMELTSASDPGFGTVGDPVIGRLRSYPSYIGRVTIGEYQYDQIGRTASRFEDDRIEGGGRMLISVGCSLLP